MEQGKWKVHHVEGPQGRTTDYRPDWKFSSNHSKGKTHLFYNWSHVYEINPASWWLLEPGSASISSWGMLTEGVWCVLMSYTYPGSAPRGSCIKPVGLRLEHLSGEWWHTSCSSRSFRGPCKAVLGTAMGFWSRAIFENMRRVDRL